MDAELPLIDTRFLNENWAYEEEPDLLHEALEIFQTKNDAIRLVQTREI